MSQTVRCVGGHELVSKVTKREDIEKGPGRLVLPGILKNGNYDKWQDANDLVLKDIEIK